MTQALVINVAPTLRPMERRHLQLVQQQPRRPRRPNLVESLDCYPRVFALLRAGESTEWLARFIHDEGECKNLSVASLARSLRRVRVRIRSAEEDRPRTSLPARPHPSDPVDAKYILRSLHHRFRLMENLIDERVSLEFRIGKLLHDTHLMFETLRCLSECILNFQMRLGEIGPQSQWRSRDGNSCIPGKIDLPKLVKDPEWCSRVQKLVSALIEDPCLLDNLSKDSATRGTARG